MMDIYKLELKHLLSLNQWEIVTSKQRGRRWEFESRSGRGAQHYVIKFVSDLRQVGGFLRLLHQ